MPSENTRPELGSPVNFDLVYQQQHLLFYEYSIFSYPTENFGWLVLGCVEDSHSVTAIEEKMESA